MTDKTHAAIAALDGKGAVGAVQVATPTALEAAEVMIKVEYAAMIAPDTYATDLGFFVDAYPYVLGYTVAGFVVRVGAGAEGFKDGDSVVAFAYGPSKRKAMQQYVVQPYTVCAKVPDNLPLDQAATIPDNFVCAFYTLFNQLGLPHPPASLASSTPPPQATTPILIYGAGSTAGQYAIQLLHHAGYKNIIATASPRHHESLRSMGATHVFDYNSERLEAEVAAAVGGEGKVPLVLDGVTAEATIKKIAGLVSPNGKVALLLPIKEGDKVTVHTSQGGMYQELRPDRTPMPEGVKVIGVKTFFYHEDEYLKENLMPKILPQLLEAGVIRPVRVRLMDKGSFLERVEEGLELLRTNKVSGEKVVVKVD
ncbi:hypothetical protein AMATHDRAFT_70233 [Amanita thiersii Skay4041]|uniref:Enoyl reductase (ER) domain-containing protein n=1 Tax=Amanita thiersii Skay4041 TaxID=703135 RepID=A0A2A9NF38_9AGAR|nr:hypothetical protein AMATHDRAFT_70233 [Amanita thiersii Skay4041]